MEKFKIKKLKDYRCSECGGYLNSNSFSHTYHCLRANCKFSIGFKEFNNIINNRKVLTK